jgi:hypothetical protein
MAALAEWVVMAAMGEMGEMEDLIKKLLEVMAVMEVLLWKAVKAGAAVQLTVFILSKEKPILFLKTI